MEVEQMEIEYNSPEYSGPSTPKLRSKQLENGQVAEFVALEDGKERFCITSGIKKQWIASERVVRLGDVR